MVRRILFVTDLHEVRAFVPALLDAEAGADLCLLGGDITSFSGADRAREVLAPLLRAFPAVRAVTGNVDLPEVARRLEDQGISLHGRGEALGGLWLSGVGGSCPTPLRGPSELGEDEIAALVRAGAPPASVTSDASKPGFRWVLVTHAPPRDTRADRMFLGLHVGSTALRACLEKSSEGPRPALHLCGHIHEGIALDRVGTTRVCNPGAFARGRYARILVHDGELVIELCRLSLPPGARLRASLQVFSSKVLGYARHRWSS